MAFAPMVRVLAFAVVIAAGQSGVAVAQQAGLGTSSDAQRDCQTVRTCNFTRNGSYRGCISAYTCRTCRLVAARCSIPGASGRACREMRCNWGA